MLHLTADDIGKIAGAALAVIFANWHITNRQTGEIMNQLRALVAHVETQHGVNEDLLRRITKNDSRIDYLFMASSPLVVKEEASDNDTEDSGRSAVPGGRRPNWKASAVES